MQRTWRHGGGGDTKFKKKKGENVYVWIITGAGEIKPRRVFLEKVNVFDGRTNRAIYREPLIERAIDFHKKLKKMQKHKNL